MHWLALALLVTATINGALSQGAGNGTASPTTTSATTSGPPTFSGWLAQFWYVLLIVVVVLVVVSVLICACVLHRQTRSSVNLDHNNQSYPLPPWNRSSSPSHQSPHRSLPVTNSSSLSEESTPVPSHSSIHSFRPQGHIRRPLSRIPSETSDTLKPDSRSDSSGGSSISLMGRNSRALDYQRARSLSHRALSSPVIQVPGIPEGRPQLYPASSTLSVGSSTSGQSGLSYRFHGNSEGGTVIEVGVTVHTPGDPDKAVSVTTAAALAESAKKLAQEAASFIDEEEETRSQSRAFHHRHATPSRTSCRSLPPHHLHHPYAGPLATASLDMPRNGVRGRLRLEEEDLSLSNSPSSMSSHLHEHDSAYHSTSSSSHLSQRPLRSSLQSIHQPRLANQPYLQRAPRERYVPNRHDFSRTSLDYDVMSGRALHCEPSPLSYMRQSRSFVHTASPAYTGAGRKQSLDGFAPAIRVNDGPRFRKMSLDGLPAGLNHRKEMMRERAMVPQREEEPIDNEQHQHLVAVPVVVEATTEPPQINGSMSRSPSTGISSQTDLSSHTSDDLARHSRGIKKPGNSDHTSHCELTSSSRTDSTPHSQHGHPGRPDEAHAHTQNSGRTANTSTTEYQSLDQPHPGGNYEQNDTVYPVTDDGQSSSSGHLTDSINITTIHV